jgi:sec-independent protein translocase protein TatA
MGNIGPGELLLIALIALLLFGAGRIADIGKGLGQGISNFKKGLKEAEKDGDDEEDEKKASKKKEKPALKKKPAVEEEEKLASAESDEEPEQEAEEEDEGKKVRVKAKA